MTIDNLYTKLNDILNGMKGELVNDFGIYNTFEVKDLLKRIEEKVDDVYKKEGNHD